VSDEVLTCWPKGFLTREEAEALRSCLNTLVWSNGESLTTEDEMALEKLQAAIEVVPVD